MSPQTLLRLAVFAELACTGFAEVPAWAADQPATAKPAGPAAAAVAQPTRNPPLPRPLAAGEVWGQDYAQGRQQARAQNRPLLVHFHATWCGPCRQMEQSVLNTGEVLSEIHARCVAIKIDSDRQPRLVEQFGVDSLPCDVFVSSDGKILSVNRGAVSVEQYKALISAAARANSPAAGSVKVAGK